MGGLLIDVIKNEGTILHYDRPKGRLRAGKAAFDRFV
jgi:hypothetical protein